MKKRRPFFSIIIPTYNRPVQLGSCLKAISLLDYPRDCFEVIVVDDGSQKSPEAVVVFYQNLFDLTLVICEHAGPADARNTGASRARGKFLAFTDDDCMPASCWLQKLAKRFEETSDCAIGGLTVNVLHDNLCSIASQLLIDYLYTYYNEDANHARFLTSNNFALPDESFHELKGFDNITFLRAAGEDREFCDRLLHHGCRVVYVPEALVFHRHELTFSAYLQQHFNYGRGAFHFHQKRYLRDKEPVRIEPASFYIQLIRYPFLKVKGRWPLMLAFLLIVSQIANAAGFYAEWISRITKKNN